MQYVGVFGIKILTGKRDMSALLLRPDLRCRNAALT
jgi:hypothetical protein